MTLKTGVMMLQHCITVIIYIFKYIQTENSYFKVIVIFHNITDFPVFLIK